MHSKPTTHRRPRPLFAFLQRHLGTFYPEGVRRPPGSVLAAHISSVFFALFLTPRVGPVISVPHIYLRGGHGWEAPQGADMLSHSRRHTVCGSVGLSVQVGCPGFCPSSLGTPAVALRQSPCPQLWTQLQRDGWPLHVGGEQDGGTMGISDPLIAQKSGEPGRNLSLCCCDIWRAGRRPWRVSGPHCDFQAGETGEGAARRPPGRDVGKQAVFCRTLQVPTRTLA